MLTLAYEAFRSFIDGPPTWERYERTVLASSPALRALHTSYGLMDQEAIRRQVETIDRDKYRPILARIDPPSLTGVYERAVSSCDAVLPPLAEVDVYLFLAAFCDCLCIHLDGKVIVMISLEYSVDRLPKIITHEYAHVLHHQRRARFSGALGALVSEGIACYLQRLTEPQSTIYDALWMMPPEDVSWCVGNEEAILKAFRESVVGGDKDEDRKFFIGGKGFASPPEGFPQKTGYYLGYRTIENVLAGCQLRDVIGLSAEDVIRRSGIGIYA